MADAVVGESKIHGQGVFATKSFSEGETVLVLGDSRIVDEMYPLRLERGEYDYHFDYLADGKIVLMPSPERHINSCCDPNTYTKTINGLRHVVARRPIQPGDEVTYDYIIDCHGGKVWQCHCGSPLCRVTVPSSFFDLPIHDQLAYLPLLNEWFAREHPKEINALKVIAEQGCPRKGLI